MLRIDDLTTVFPSDRGPAAVIDGVSLTVDAGEVVALVGESGCGKSMTALSILRLVPPPGRIAGGRILLDGDDLLTLPVTAMRRVRGKQIAMIFQEPGTSLNPVLTVGGQVIEAIRLHEDTSRAAARARAVELFDQVGIPDPSERVDAYPHQLSGGMKQRVMIAMALAARPRLLIADEPTTALDVTIQAQILELLQHLQEVLGMAVLLITHDLGVVAETADRVAVMYAGQVVEYCDVHSAFKRTLHPYTAGLLDALPRLGVKQESLRVIPGNVPDPLRFPPGCRFHPRCPVAQQRCRESEPPVLMFDGDHQARCWRADEIAAGVLDPAGEEAIRG